MSSNRTLRYIIVYLVGTDLFLYSEHDIFDLVLASIFVYNMDVY